MLGLGLPLLVAAPSWWKLHNQRSTLDATEKALEAALSRLAEAEQTLDTNARLRSDLLSRFAVTEALHEGADVATRWLGMLGHLPAGCDLTRAAMHDLSWQIEGTAASVDVVEKARARFEQAGWRVDPAAEVQSAESGVRFVLRGQAPVDAR